MKTLDRKLVRDVVRLRWQAATIAIVIAAGIAVFVGALSTYRSLWTSKERYYRESAFADVFARASRAPLSVAERLRDVPGVTRVVPRISVDVTLTLPGGSETSTGKLVAGPSPSTAPLDRVYLRVGRDPAPERVDEVVVSEAFADANHLGPGDTLLAVMNGRQRQLHVVGVGLSPEFIFAVRPGDFVPDDRRFAVLWSTYDTAATAFDMAGTFNDVALALGPDARLGDVLSAVDALLAPYGGIDAYGRADQMSEKYLSQEITQLRGSATVIPSIFLAVAAFLLNIVLSRVVAIQRDQIATLKALGYDGATIGAHFGKLAIAIVVVGALLGTAGGASLGSAMTGLYASFFRLPTLAYDLDPTVTVAAIAVSLISGVGGALGVVRRVARLAPAAAMGPPPPPRYHATLLHRLGVERFFGAMGRMVVRDLERRPLRGILTSVGVGAAVSILIAGTFSLDSVDYVMDLELRIAQAADATASFTRNVSGHAVLEVAHVPGIRYAEGLRLLPARLRNGSRSRQVAITGLDRDASLKLVLSRDMHADRVPEDGVLLSAELARRLAVGVGDDLVVEVLEGARPERVVPVRGLVDDLVGSSCYASRELLNRWMDEGDVVNAAHLAVDPDAFEGAVAAVGRAPQVASVTSKRALFETFERTTAQYSRVFTWFLAGFAAVIAIGIVYNGARILVSERERELATLRVLGFTRAEVSTLLLSELGAEVLLGLPLGFGFGYLLSLLAASGVDAELFRLPVIIEPRTYGFAALVVAGASILSALRVRARLDHLDLVAALKVKE